MGLILSVVLSLVLVGGLAPKYNPTREERKK